jgi:hypothetical protein
MGAIMEGRVRRGGLVWPIMLIGAGVIFLLNNAGILSWNVWAGLWRFWPVILIAIGLDILIGRRSQLGSLLVALLTVGLLVMLAFNWGVQASAGSQLHVVAINQGLDGAQDADVDLDPGLANLQLSEAQESASLIEGTITLSGNEQALPRFWRTGDTAHFEMHAQGGQPAAGLDLGENRKLWDLRLAPDVPLRLQLNPGVGNAAVDLTHLDVTRLTMQGGVGSTTITMPRAGRVSVTLDGGVGRLRVIVPPSMAARVQVNRGLGGFDVSGSFQKNGDVYVSTGYEAAQDRANIVINAGIGRVSVEQGAGD